MRRERILHVINSSHQGGGARHLLDLLTHLDRDRFEPVVATAGDGPLVERLGELGVGVERVEMMRSRVDPRPVVALHRLLTREPVDLLHLHGTRAGFFGTLAAGTLANRPRVVYTVHGLASSRWASRPVRGLFGRVERFTSRRADRVISVSEHDRRSGVEHGLLPPERTATIPNGLDLAAIPGTFREPFSEPGVIDLVTLARLVPQKGIGVLLEAMTGVLSRHPGCRLTVVGEGPLRGSLEEQVARRGMTGRVRLPGASADPWAPLASCDVFVLPSLWEGMPLSLLEAMAVARPVVATSVSGSAELVLPGETGVLVPPGDPAALGAALDELLAHPEAAAAMGARARDRVRREFSLDRMVTSTYALYHDLLAEAAPHRTRARQVRYSS